MKKNSDSSQSSPVLCRFQVDRRTVLGGMAGLAGLSVLPASAQDDIATAPPAPGDYLVFAGGEDRTTPLTPDSLVPNAGQVQAWPVDPATDTVRNGTLYNLLVLTRWDPAVLSPEGQEYAAEGVVAQTAICTHAACEVTDWIADSFHMECPCHFSRFDPRQNGAVIQGPATRKLPALALAMEDGRIVVKAPFDGRVGGDTA
ncbi:ubiquinol-cytochrome c reductase iron-sulfur subunit [Pelagibacterium lacus]|nr:Rieske (2Fe-2S) protein [Pelagibacterium lacus]